MRGQPKKQTTRASEALAMLGVIQARAAEAERILMLWTEGTKRHPADLGYLQTVAAQARKLSSLIGGLQAD